MFKSVNFFILSIYLFPKTFRIYADMQFIHVRSIYELQLFHYSTTIECLTNGDYFN